MGYAGLQKNLGPAGMSVGIIRPDFADGKNELSICPTYCSWKTCADAGSMYNTPACYTMYVMGEYLKYTKKVGGLRASLYNGMPVEGVEKLADFMKSFMDENRK